MSSEHLNRHQFRMFAVGHNGEDLSLEPGTDPVAYKEYDRVKDMLGQARSVTEAYPYDEHNLQYGPHTVPIKEYVVHEGALSHRIEPGTGKAIEENIRR